MEQLPSEGDSDIGDEIFRIVLEQLLGLRQTPNALNGKVNVVSHKIPVV